MDLVWRNTDAPGPQTFYFIPDYLCVNLATQTGFSIPMNSVLNTDEIISNAPFPCCPFTRMHITCALLLQAFSFVQQVVVGMAAFMLPATPRMIYFFYIYNQHELDSIFDRRCFNQVSKG